MGDSAAIMIWTWIAHALGQAPHREHGGGGNAVVNAVRNIIEEEYANPELSVDHIAARVNRHPSALTRLMRQRTGDSVVNLIQQKRLSISQKLLLESGRTIADVSAACGYSTPRYFTKVFKSLTGVTPSHYRRLGHNEADLS